VSDAESGGQTLRYLLKISARPGAVVVTADSRLIAGSADGHLVVFNLKVLTPFEGKRHY